MTFLVPFDGSDFAASALVRAMQFADALDEAVLAVTVVPQDNAAYASSRGWLDADEPFDSDAVAETLRTRVAGLAPEAEVRIEEIGRYAPSGAIANRLRKVARQTDTSILFIGSDNAGRLVSSVASVGSGLAGNETYDVIVVRRPHAGTVAGE
jgi:nucleotide-binding universal stress UspA family protein